MKSYPLGDNLTRVELAWLGIAEEARQYPCIFMHGRLPDGRRVRAVTTGVKRPPRAGEWYLSGAPASAYRAPNDLSTAYHIMRLVVVPSLEKALRNLLEYVTSGRRYEKRNPYTIPEVQAALLALDAADAENGR